MSFTPAKVQACYMPPVNVDAVLALAVVRFVRQLDDCELPDEALTFTKKGEIGSRCVKQLDRASESLRRFQKSHNKNEMLRYDAMSQAKAHVFCAIEALWNAKLIPDASVSIAVALAAVDGLLEKADDHASAEFEMCWVTGELERLGSLILNLPQEMDREKKATRTVASLLAVWLAGSHVDRAQVEQWVRKIFPDSLNASDERIRAMRSSIFHNLDKLIGDFPGAFCSLNSNGRVRPRRFRQKRSDRQVPQITGVPIRLQSPDP